MIKTAKTTALKKGDTIRLERTKQVLICKGANNGRKGLVQPWDVLLVHHTEKDYTLFKVGKQTLKKPFISHGDIVRISNDSLINLQFKRL
jgi:hypothetical protein